MLEDGPEAGKAGEQKHKTNIHNVQIITEIDVVNITVRLRGTIGIYTRVSIGQMQTDTPTIYKQ